MLAGFDKAVPGAYQSRGSGSQQIGECKQEGFLPASLGCGPSHSGQHNNNQGSSTLESSVRIATVVAGLLGTPPGAGVALADDSGSADAADGTVLQEVVVTAQHRAENLQNVPLSVTALSQQDMDEDQRRGRVPFRGGGDALTTPAAGPAAG